MFILLLYFCYNLQLHTCFCFSAAVGKKRKKSCQHFFFVVVDIMWRILMICFSLLTEEDIFGKRRHFVTTHYVWRGRQLLECLESSFWPRHRKVCFSLGLIVMSWYSDHSDHSLSLWLLRGRQRPLWWTRGVKKLTHLLFCKIFQIKICHIFIFQVFFIKHSKFLY